MNTTLALRIYHRGVDTQPTALAPGTEMYDKIAVAVDYTFMMMEEPDALNHLSQLAVRTDNHFRNGMLFQGNLTSAQQSVRWLINLLQNKSMMYVIDERVDNPNIIAFHRRGVWTGGLADFDPRLHAIYINAERVRSMILAAQDPNNGTRYVIFLCLFACTFFHEMGGHVLVTWLTNGGDTTPHTIGAEGFIIENEEESEGESGRFLEKYLFGGTIEYYRNPNNSHDNTQPGIPYLISQHDEPITFIGGHQSMGTGHAYPIDKRFIVSCIMNCRFTFQFPVDPEGRVRPSAMTPMGGRNGAIQSSPMSRNTMARCLQAPEYRVSRRALREIPRNPSQRLIPV